MWVGMKWSRKGASGVVKIQPVEETSKKGEREETSKMV